MLTIHCIQTQHTCCAGRTDIEAGAGEKDRQFIRLPDESEVPKSEPNTVSILFLIADEEGYCGVLVEESAKESSTEDELSGVM